MRRTSRRRSTRASSTASTSNLPTFHRYLKLRQRMLKVPRAPLLRSLRPARRVGRPDLHAQTKRRRTSSKRWRRSARSTRPRAKRAFSERWIDLFPNDGKRAGAYSNGGAYDVHPVHAAQLQRQVHGRQHADARARAHDAQLLLEQDAAVRDGELPDVRRRGRVDVQRSAAHREHAEARSPTLPPGCRSSATTWRTSRAPFSGRRSSPSSSCERTR